MCVHHIHVHAPPLPCALGYQAVEALGRLLTDKAVAEVRAKHSQVRSSRMQEYKKIEHAMVTNYGSRMTRCVTA